MIFPQCRMGELSSPAGFFLPVFSGLISGVPILFCPKSSFSRVYQYTRCQHLFTVLFSRTLHRLEDQCDRLPSSKPGASRFVGTWTRPPPNFPTTGPSLASDTPISMTRLNPIVYRHRMRPRRVLYTRRPYPKRKPNDLEVKEDAFRSTKILDVLLNVEAGEVYVGEG